MIVIFLNASGIDFGNFLNAHLRSKMLALNYVRSVNARAWESPIVSWLLSQNRK